MDIATAVRIWRQVSGGVDDIVTGRTLEAFASRVEAAEREACAHKVPDVLFDGHAVYKALDARAIKRTGPENVVDVLDAVVRLMHSNVQVSGERIESA